MCGLVGVFGANDAHRSVEHAIGVLSHRGPDDESIWASPDARAALGFRRLSILDLTSAGRQPMVDPRTGVVLAFNGEIYNHVELRRDLKVPIQSSGDTEVLLAAWNAWGERCLDRLIGMFAFAIWDERRHALFLARDRFGVKPLYMADLPGGGLGVSSEIKALHSIGVAPTPDTSAWAEYLASGVSDFDDKTFWAGIRPLPPGHWCKWDSASGAAIEPWYDVDRATAETDERDDDVVAEEYIALLENSVRLRFRADVPVGIALSGGVDSSTLLAVVHQVQGVDSSVAAFTFVTGDERYDELPWVELMLEKTQHALEICALSAA